MDNENKHLSRFDESENSLSLDKIHHRADMFRIGLIIISAILILVAIIIIVIKYTVK